MRLALLALAGFLVACGELEASDVKVLRIPMDTSGPKSLDPVRGSTTYENRVCSAVYEGLVQYKYLERPFDLEPALLERMPERSADGRTYRCRLKRGVRFQDNECFPGGKGREVVARDVFYSWKRMADEDNEPKSWWLFENTILGFDAYREAQNGADEFDYDVPVEGMRLFEDDPYRFEIVLEKPVTPFLFILAMFQTFVVPREAVEYWGDRFSRNPVGTGAFMLRRSKDWIPGHSIRLYRNPTYREDRYPTEFSAADREAGLDAAAGQRLPFVDRIDITFFVEVQPKWLEFVSGNLDFTTVPAEYFEEAFIKRTRKLRKDWRDRGVRADAVPLLDFIFRGFNMEDELLGGYTEEKRALRRALHLAVDHYEFNDAFYNGINRIYDGPIPPGLKGHPEEGLLPYGNQGPDLDRAQKLLAKAGYPDGKGLPPLQFWTGAGANSKEQTEMMQRQLGRIGVELDVRLVDFGTLIENVHKKKVPFFSFAWGSDYPDAENNLAIFYGPNEAPASNSYNYKNPEYDELYRRVKSMPRGPERVKIIEKMRDMLIRDVPYIGSMARIRYYLSRPWLKNFKPTETFAGWWKYLDVDEARR